MIKPTKANPLSNKLYIIFFFYLNRKKMTAILDNWQREILEHKGNLVLCTGRQVGKTFTMSQKAAKYMIDNPNSKIIIVSLTEDQAKLMIVMILDYLEKNYKTSISKGKDKPTQNKVVLRNKSQVIARPVGNTGDAVRGFTGNVLIIDEASRMPKIAFEAALPTLASTGGEIWMCSTPHGKQGYFWDSFNNKERFKVFHISTEEVYRNRPLSEEWTEKRKEESIKFVEQEKKDKSELMYGQEYLGLFLDDLQRFFSDAWINKLSILSPPKEDDFPKFYNMMGVDIARMGNDKIAYEVLHQRKTVWHHVLSISKSKQDTVQTENDIIGLTQTLNIDRVGIDAGSGSLGVGVLDHLLKHPVTGRKVIAMNNRKISLDKDEKERQTLFKEDMYENLKSMGEHNEILLLDDLDLRIQLQSIQIEYDENTSKTYIYGTPSPDKVEALVRAAYLAKKEKIFKLDIHWL